MTQNKTVRFFRENGQPIFWVSLLAFLFIGYTNCAQQRFMFNLTQDRKDQGAQAIGYQILIENGAPYTRDINVQVQFPKGDKSNQIYVTNDPTCKTGGVWEPFVPEKSWKLARANQKARVFAMFKKEDGGTVCVSDDIIHDGVAPSIAYTNTPEALSNVANVSFSYQAQDNLSGVKALECADAAQGPFQNCPSPAQRNLSVEGSKSFFVRAVDNAGNISAVLPYSWVFDKTPPLITLNQTPSSVSGSTDATFVYTITDAVSGVDTAECALDNAPLARCDLTRSTFSGLTESAHRFRIVATDRAKNRSQEISFSWTIDTTKPTVTITKTPPPFSKDRNGSVEFVGMDGGQPLNRFECQLDGAGYSACNSPKNFSGLADGSHTITVRGYDNAGNVSDPTSYTWIIDTLAPIVRVVDQPAPYTKENSTTIRYETNETGSGIDKRICTVDGQPVNCDGQTITIPTVAEGNHTATMKVIDRSGNESNEVVIRWTVDRSPPDIRITKAPSPLTKSSEAEFEFIGKDNDQVVGYTCRLDSGATEACSSPKKYDSLPEGNHTFYVRAVDRAGNESVNPAMFQWVVDYTGPNIVISPYTASIKSTQTANFTHAVTDAYSSVQSVSCGLEGRMTSCNVSMTSTFNGLSQGDYKFIVTAADALGNVSTEFKIVHVTDGFIDRQDDLVVPQANRDVDILFVIDNSGSMSEEQANMKNRISGFIDKVKHLNYRISVTSTDPWENGRQRTFDNGSTVLTPAVSNAQDLLGNAIQMGISGSGDERGINATYQSVARAKTGPEQNLYRTNAALAVISITDEDECSSGCSSMYPSSDPNNLVQLVKSQFGPSKLFTYNSIIKLPNDPTCTTAAYPAHTHARLSDLTSGIKGNICAADYASILQSIGSSVAALVSTVELKCAPKARIGSGNGITKVEYVGSSVAPPAIQEVKGKLVAFAQPLAEGQTVRISYTCEN